MLLNELFKSNDKKFDIEVTAETPTNFKAQTTLSDGTIVDIGNVKGEMGEWSLAFARDGRMDLSAAGKEMEVFAAMKQMMDIFQEKYNPEKISMMVSGDNRAKLYERMIKRLLPGWEIDSFKFGSEMYMIDAEKK